MLAAVLAAALLAIPASAVAAQTVVSLTFDDGWADNYTTRSMLAEHRMLGTFYVNSNVVGSDGFMSWAHLEALNADGHEIAGHTLDHVDLTSVSTDEARRQVCDDRANLIARGFIVPSFAYPFGEYNSTVKTIVRDCGYASGRGAWGLRNFTATTDTRPYAEKIPPSDRYAIRTPCCLRSDITLETLKDYITKAEQNGGGWVPLVFHRVCDDCGGDAPAPSTTPATLEGLLAWLKPRSSQGTVVRTVHQVISGDAQPPTSSIACSASTCSTGWYTSSVSVGLAATDAGSGVSTIRYTVDGSEPTVSSPVFSGPFTVSATTTVKYRAWDKAGNVEPTKTQVVRIDGQTPTSSIACNTAACSSAWYTSAVTVGLSASDDDSGVAVIRYTVDGSEPTAFSPAYSGAFAVESTTTVKYRAWDNAGNVEATGSQEIRIDAALPESSITCNGSLCSSSPYTNSVTIALSATDSGSGVAAIRYTLDGSDPTASSAVYSGAFAVSETTTVKYRASDEAGNIEAAKSQLVRVERTSTTDTAAPISSITCDDGACSSGWYTAAVSLALSATDDDSGVAAIRYTLDGSEPTESSALYSGPFTVSTTTTVKYRAWDNAGNVESVRSQLVQIDTAPPESVATCDGSPCSSSWYRTSVTLALGAVDGDSGVAAIRYTVDGSEPTASSPAYTSPFTVSQTTTVRYRAWDNAGNVEAMKSQLVQIDGESPSVAITSPADGATVKGVVKVTAAASDAGSGIARVSFYANGALIGTKTSAPYTVNWNTNKLKGEYTLTAVAEDVAGNTRTSSPVKVRVG